MSVRLFVLSALTAVSALPAAMVAQERQPVPRPKVYIDGGDGPEVIRDRLRVITQRRYRIGVNVDLRASETDSIGASVLSVTPGGSAAKAGIKSGDVITKFNGKSRVATDNTRAAEDESLPGVRLVELASQLKANETVSLEYLRDGVRKTVSLITGNEPVFSANGFGDGNELDRMPGIMMKRTPFGGGTFSTEELPGGGFGYQFLMGGPLADLELAPLNADLGSYFGTTEGVLVISVPKESSLGLKGGDVILNLDGRKATGPNSFLRLLRSYEPGESFKLEIMRNKARTTVTGQIEKGRERDRDQDR
jgi:S1-C subfamily serine protease